MSDDNKEVLQAITILTSKVEEYHGDFREFRGEIKARVEDVEHKIQVIEDGASSDRKWMRIQSAAVIPVVGALHQLAKHFGL
jgi:hypothetical protein